MSPEQTLRAGSAPDRAQTAPMPVVARPLIVVETDPTADPVDLDRLDAAVAELLLALPADRPT